MKLIILGSGTGMPLSYRASPSIVLFIDRSPILLDIGPGTLHQLTRVGLNHYQINRIFITHFHPDHTADLVPFLFVTRNPSIIAKREPFVIIGARGLRSLIHRLQTAYIDYLNLPSEIMSIEELDNQEITERDYQQFKIIAHPVSHSSSSLAYRIEDKRRKSIVYSGDTGFCDEIIDLARGSELLILESSFPDGAEVDGHLTPGQAGNIASLAGIKRLVLTHFYPECLKTDIAKQCRRYFDGELILASDLLHILI